MSTTPYPGPDEVIIPSRIYFDEGKRIDVKVWPKTIQLTGPTKDLNKVFKTLEEYDDWWHQFKKKNPDAFRKDAKYVKSINGLFLIQKKALSDTQQKPQLSNLGYCIFKNKVLNLHQRKEIYYSFKI